MMNFACLRWKSVICLPVATAVLGLTTSLAIAQPRPSYIPISISPGTTINDKLSDKDIPTGQGGFAKDYSLKLNAGDQITVDLTSNDFDTIISLIAADGSTVAENDDGPDGSSNSLLFTRITKSGNYIVRVRTFGEAAIGAFTLKVTRLKPF